MKPLARELDRIGQVVGKEDGSRNAHRLVRVLLLGEAIGSLTVDRLSGARQ